MRKNKKTKNKKQDSLKRNREAAALFFALASFLSAYVFIVRSRSGILGGAFFAVMFAVFGPTIYILPLIFLRYFIIHIMQSVELSKKLDFIWSVICIVSCSVLFKAVCLTFVPTTKIFSGGWVGDNLYPFFKELFGVWLGFAVIIAIFLFSVAKLFRISINNFLKNPEASITKVEEEKVQDIAQAKKQEYLILQKSDRAIPKPNILSRQEKEEKKKAESLICPTVKQTKVDSKIFDYKLPVAGLLKNDSAADFETGKDELLKRAELLRTTLADFDIDAKVKDIIPGPVVTRYDLILSPGIRIQTVSGIIDNISLAMRTASIRVVPIPEKAVVGIEVPNSSGIIVGLRGILESATFENSKSLLTLALGKTTDGSGYVTDLASMPHLLIAGATGSGKSVSIHTIILSILYKARPDEVKFMLIDPKRVEMPIYRDIPHIYNPCTCATNADIITGHREAAVALKKLVNVMDERYTKFAKAMARNIEDYNSKMVETGGEKEFYIVVIIDELADLMTVVQKEIEDSVQRLAQMARAVGIHLILATQRPSVNVVTGIIKANFPARLSFQTTSKIDSRVILDMLGAECLMGKGDMLFLPPGEARPARLQGAYVSLKEAEKVISFINEQNFPRSYEPVVAEVERTVGFNADKEKRTRDLIPALKLINERKRISQDLLKANFGGSARATNILSILETRGFITKPEGTNKWQIDYDKIRQYLEETERGACAERQS
ncbi:FtsK/SpoIIIE family DNA translocase [Candidatus Endomicrobiellum trichonymphae]|uniref:FtsK/SpoIIIE family DNA translocase n=1 Tax=Endomicrobium trichonymphae TaxID=1408204 RepID=UPI0008665BAA|nr:DNA translocase FtsK [Candidatus Endomicrobium trichonymphae]BAV58727.1 cell division protein FtsK [Candidatus Endomicrobium trichonymphae]